MRPAAHRYHPELHPTRRSPAFRVVRSHRRPRAGWPPLVGASAMILLGFTAAWLTLAASRGPAVGPVHTGRPPVAGMPLVPQQVASDPPVDQGDGQGQQRGDDQVSRSTPRPTFPDSGSVPGPGQMPTAPAANSPADPAPLLLPEPTSPPAMAVPSPSPTPGPGCGRKPPHPTRSPRVQIAA